MELRNRNFILIDTETTGFNEKKNQILEIGILVIKNLKVVDEINIKVKHKEYVVTAKALEVNKINIVEHEKEALCEVEAAEMMLNFLEKNKKDDEESYIVYGQNVQFDIKFIEEMFLRTNKIKEYRKVVSYRCLDLMQVAMLKNIEGKIYLEKQDLDTILTTLNIEIPQERHSAIVDCYLEYRALVGLLKL